MRLVAGLVGSFMLLVVLIDAFETMILPRRVNQRIRLTRFFYYFAWWITVSLARRMRPGNRRENFLSVFGPLSLLLLLIVWAVGLVTSFALIQWGLGSQINVQHGVPTLFTDLYMSGTTFFTLGLGDITPATPVARFLTVLEAGTGFGFLAVVIGYLPVLYQAFSRREVTISLLDARAGSPPTAAELLRRQYPNHGTASLIDLLHEWERWCAELLESHLSYPALGYYRSQHDQQSWLAALATILDLCALVMINCDAGAASAAQLTFAMARHAAVDLSQIFNTRPHRDPNQRLSASDMAQMTTLLATVGISFEVDGRAQQLSELRRMYEPYLTALSDYLLLPLPKWVPATAATDDWQNSAWEHATVRPSHAERNHP